MIVNPATDADLAVSRVERLRAEIYMKAADVCMSAMSFADVDFDAEEPPEAWVAELGPEEAARRFRVAKSAQLSNRDAPAALKIATTILVGAMRDDALVRSAPKLNVQLVELSYSPEPEEYPSREVEE